MVCLECLAVRRQNTPATRSPTRARVCARIDPMDVFTTAQDCPALQHRVRVKRWRWLVAVSVGCSDAAALEGLLAFCRLPISTLLVNFYDCEPRHGLLSHLNDCHVESAHVPGQHTFFWQQILTPAKVQDYDAPTPTCLRTRVGSTCIVSRRGSITLAHLCCSLLSIPVLETGGRPIGRLYE